MKTEHALKHLMLELLYPAVLGAIIYLILSYFGTPFAERYLFGSRDASLSKVTYLQIALLSITIFFYCIDYLYVMFTKRYNGLFFVFDLSFLIVLYVTFTKEYHLPNVKVIVLCYATFLALYFVWDLRENFRCTNEN